jgi:hypothetical protein
MKFLSWRFFFFLVLLSSGFSLFFVITERIIISRPPAEGLRETISLTSPQPYEYTIYAPSPISCLSLFFRPTTITLPNDSLTVITLTPPDRSATIATPFIDRLGSTKACFNPPLQVPPQTAFTFSLHLPSSLDKKLELKQSSATGEPALEIFTPYRPPLAWQLGGLLLLLALGLWLRSPMHLPALLLFASIFLATESFTLSGILFRSLFSLLSLLALPFLRKYLQAYQVTPYLISLLTYLILLTLWHAL